MSYDPKPLMVFDHRTSSFMLEDARIGPDTQPQDLASRVLGTLDDVVGHPGWVNFTSSEEPLAVFVAFRDGVIHSGCFWCNIFADDGWREAERVEAQRREQHEAIARRLFGAPAYEDARIKVELLRDPRAFLEMIFFAFKG